VLASTRASNGASDDRPCRRHVRLPWQVGRRPVPRSTHSSANAEEESAEENSGERAEPSAIAFCARHYIYAPQALPVAA
jgi:hypothetical protein